MSFDCLNLTVFSGDVYVPLFNGLPVSKARCDAKPLMEEKKLGVIGCLTCRSDVVLAVLGQ